MVPSGLTAPAGALCTSRWARASRPLMSSPADDDGQARHRRSVQGVHAGAGQGGGRDTTRRGGRHRYSPAGVSGPQAGSRLSAKARGPSS